jgi:hypothetical protein
MEIRHHLSSAAASFALVQLAFPTALAAQAIHLPAARTSVVWAAGGLAVVMALVGIVLLWRHRHSEVDPDEAELPPLLFPATPANQNRRARPAAVYVPGVVAPTGPVVQSASPAPAPTAGTTVDQSPSDMRAPRPATPAVSRAPIEAPVPSLIEERNGSEAPVSDGAENTLQILPGRLAVVEGMDKSEPVRFVRTGPRVEVTFGRAEGPLYEHVQLRSQTVSRKHACMRFDGAGWTLVNFSRTNPVTVNGEELIADGDPRRLHEGDRIGMGEVTFIFHER